MVKTIVEKDADDLLRIVVVVTNRDSEPIGITSVRLRKPRSARILGVFPHRRQRDEKTELAPEGTIESALALSLAPAGTPARQLGRLELANTGDQAYFVTYISGARHGQSQVELELLTVCTNAAARRKPKRVAVAADMSSTES